jgi:hypothetical protein
MMARHIAYEPSWRGKITQKYNDAMGFFRIVIHFKEESLVEPKVIDPKYYKHLKGAAQHSHLGR